MGAEKGGVCNNKICISVKAYVHMTQKSTYYYIKSFIIFKAKFLYLEVGRYHLYRLHCVEHPTASQLGFHSSVIKSMRRERYATEYLD